MDQERTVTLPFAIIVDIDGTLADNSHRLHLVKDNKHPDWTKYRSLVMEDKPNRWCVEIIKGVRALEHEILFVTGRNERERSMTEEWLQKVVPFAANPYFKLYMRPDDDYRGDFIVKREIFYKEIWSKYTVLCAIDDRRQVIDMWREIGLPCLACADND